MIGKARWYGPAALVMLCLAASLGGAGHALAQEAPAAIDAKRLEAARGLIEATGAKKQIELMLDVMKDGITKGAIEAGGGADQAARMEAEFAEFSKRFQTYRDQMVDDLSALYAERFTTAELDEISGFYRSGTGAKFIAAMPELMQRGGAIGQKYGIQAMRDLEALKKKSGDSKGESKP
ncbi:MAG: DUF2059 domain-containing protein [Hyphomicrobiaceae bacterium]